MNFAFVSRELGHRCDPECLLGIPLERVVDVTVTLMKVVELIHLHETPLNLISTALDDNGLKSRVDLRGP